MISIITISLSIIVAAIVVYLLLKKLKIIGTDIINYNNGIITMYKHPEPDIRTGKNTTGPFLIFKLKYTVLQNGLIDVTYCSAGLPLINVKVPGWYSVTVKGVLRNISLPGNVAQFRIMQDSNISNMYFREDSHINDNNEYPINVENRHIFIDKPVKLRYGIMYDPDTTIQPYEHDIEFEMIKVI